MSTVVVHPTLSLMDAIYALSREGGAQSSRFRTYLRHAGDRGGNGLQHYNPMAGEDAAATVQELLWNDAESQVMSVAQQFMHDCNVAIDAVEIALVVRTPGLWTHRLITEVESMTASHRESPATVTIWAGEATAEEAVQSATRQEMARLVWNHRWGQPTNVHEVLSRSGFADWAADMSLLADGIDDRLRNKVGQLCASEEQQHIWTLYAGDGIAEAMGWEPLDIGDGAGRAYALGCASDAHNGMDLSQALNTEPTWLC